MCDKEFSRKDNLQRHIVNTHLEYDNHNNTKIQKIPFHNNSSALITKVVTDESSSIAEETSPIPKAAVRTESVIKSLTKTHEIVDFQCQDREGQCNRISVIQKVGKLSTPHDTNSTQEIYHCQPGSHPVIPLLDIQPLDDFNVEPIVYELPTKEDRLVDTYESIKNWDDSVREHFAEYSSSTEAVKSPRCFLPKKLITASYKERSIYNDRASYSSTKLTVIMTGEK